MGGLGSQESGANLDEVPGAAVDADVIQLQTDDLIGLADDEGGAGQLWLGCGEGEVAVGGQHVQASWRQKLTLNPKNQDTLVWSRWKRTEG